MAQAVREMFAVTRYKIEDDHGRRWNGEEFTHDEDDFETYMRADEAHEEAERVGGYVEKFGTFAPIPDRPTGPVFHLAAAE